MRTFTPGSTLVGIRAWIHGEGGKENYKNSLQPRIEELLRRGFVPAVAINYERDCRETKYWLHGDFGRAVIVQEFLPWSSGMSSIDWFVQVAVQDHLQATALMSCDVSPVCPGTNGEGRIEHLLSILYADPMAVAVGAAFSFQVLPEHDGIYPWAYNFGPRNTLVVYRTACMALTGLPPAVCSSRNAQVHGMEEAMKFRVIVNQPQFHGGQAHLVVLPGGPVEVDLSHREPRQREMYYAKFQPGGLEYLMFQRQMVALQQYHLTHPEVSFFRSVGGALEKLKGRSHQQDQMWRDLLASALPLKDRMQ